jgi:hypothetical protein
VKVGGRGCDLGGGSNGRQAPSKVFDGIALNALKRQVTAQP